VEETYKLKKSMKYIITEPQIEQIIFKTLNKLYGNLEEYKTDEYPNRIFFVKDKKVYMELEMDELSSDILWVGYETIWGDLKDMFDLKASEIKYVIIKWVEDTYNLNVSTLAVEECPSIYFSKL
jgi:hypothetical protein